MAGPLDIQRYPTSLVDLLGMRSTGDTPHELAQQVALTLDGLDYYLINRKVNFTGASAAANAVGQILTFAGLPTVPPGQVWAVYSWSYWWGTQPAGANLVLHGYYDFASTVGRVFLDAPFAGQVAGMGGYGRVFYKPHLVGPGSQFRAWVTGITGVPNQAVTLELTYAVLAI